VGAIGPIWAAQTGGAEEAKGAMGGGKHNSASSTHN